MADDPRLLLLLDKLIESDATPDSVCKSCPELLPELRQRWRRIARLRADLDALFPAYESVARPLLARPLHETKLPQLPAYEVLSVLGRGGMGIVFRARHFRLNRVVAVKMLLADTFATQVERSRFQREAEILAGLVHPNIVQIHDVGDSDGRPFFTMEYVEGGSLAGQLAGIPQPPRQAAALLATVADAVQAAHARGIVHRDLKPGNVLLGENGIPKVTDFGLARLSSDGASLTQIGTAIGTPSYMAPEQARGQPDAIGAAVDIYALGAILYELLTGRPPFRAATAAETVQQVISQEPAPPTRLNDQVPRDLETICLKCLNKIPTLRYRTAAELADDLRRYLACKPILARRATPAERLGKWIRRNPWLATSLFSIMLLLNVIVVVIQSAVTDRMHLIRTVEADFREVGEAEQRQSWGEARNVLERAKGRLGGGGPADLRRRSDELERELALVVELENVLLSTLETNSLDSLAQRTAARYETALRKAGLVNGSEDPLTVATRIRATGIAAPVLAALDCWAWRDEGRREWLQNVARYVDQDPASSPLRDSKLWNDMPALEEFAQSAPLANQSVPLLHLLGTRLHLQGGNSVAYYRRVQQAHPNSDMANASLAVVLRVKGEVVDSLRYFEAAIALRPDHADFHYTFGKALDSVGRWDEALAHFVEASRLAPESPAFKTDVGVALHHVKGPAVAERWFRSVLETHPDFTPCLMELARSQFDQGQHDSAIDTLHRAIATDPKHYPAYRQLVEHLLKLRRWQEGRVVWKKWLHANPPTHQDWDEYATLCLYLEDKSEYQSARIELLKKFEKTTDPQVAERMGRCCLLLPASVEELRQATALVDRAVESEREKPTWRLPYFRFAKALAEYRAGSSDSAMRLLDADTRRVLGPAPWLLLAMILHGQGKADAAREAHRVGIAPFDWDAKTATGGDAWMFHVMRREAESVLASQP